MDTKTNLSLQLSPTKFIDSNTASIVEYATRLSSGLVSDKDKIIAAYYAVRDDIQYDPYHIVLSPNAISASQTLQRGTGYCVEKSLLLAAVGRVLKIPSRLGFAIVRNHLATDKFQRLLRTDKYVFHGYNDFLIAGKWIKCTPAFNLSLCKKFGVAPLEFDGENDSIFHEFDSNGNQYMEYLHAYGVFDDLPYDLFVRELQKHYPHLFKSIPKGENQSSFSKP